jgi:hypothetical protein
MGDVLRMQKALLFVNKMKQKNSIILVLGHLALAVQKFFGAFFQKSTACLFRFC